MGVKPGGNIALLACAGPMGIGAIDYAINGGIQPSRVVVVDIDDKRLAQVQKLLPVDLAASKGIELVYVNTKGMSDPVQTLRALTGDVGFDDIFVYAAVPAVVEMADELLAEDGCLNFFAGPTDKNFKVPFNFYNVHYNSTHVVGGFAPIFPDTCYHLTHYWLAAVDIPVASDNPVHYADAIRYNARMPLQGSLLPLTRLVWA